MFREGLRILLDVKRRTKKNKLLTTNMGPGPKALSLVGVKRKEK